MATNNLMEAAADILAGSKKSAPAESASKVQAPVQDLGGPTNKDAKPTDDSEKIDPHAPANSAKNQASVKMKPSAASAKTEETEVEETEVVAEEQSEDTLDLSEDINAIFADDSTISEEFKQKVTTIFEARVLDRVSQIQEQLETQYADMFTEAVEQIGQELTEKVDDYLNYVVEQWMEENQLAIESGLRSELTEEFISGLRQLFVEHYIDVPEEKVDLVNELAARVEELESNLNEEIQRNVEYHKELVESVKREITSEVCEGLTVTQAEKIKTLAESVEFSTAEDFEEKLLTIRENYFPSNVKSADESQLQETVEDEAQPQINDAFVAAVSKAISKTKL